MPGASTAVAIHLSIAADAKLELFHMNLQFQLQSTPGMDRLTEPCSDKRLQEAFSSQQHPRSFLVGHQYPIHWQEIQSYPGQLKMSSKWLSCMQSQGIVASKTEATEEVAHRIVNKSRGRRMLRDLAWLGCILIHSWIDCMPHTTHISA